MALQMLTNVSVAFIYQEASFKSESTSQTYLAESLEILDDQEHWILIRQEDGYEGWVARFFVVDKPENWNGHNFYHHGAPISWVYQSPDRQSETIRDITLLSKLPVLEYQGAWVKVLLPDGLSGWVENNPRIPVASPDIEQVIQTAFAFLGTQYSWGGRSPKGFDCSGFVQTCFLLNGVQLPRDARQQALVGKPVDDAFNLWAVGDLIFFTERSENITHVAISLGNGDFIHSSGFVKLNSLNPENTSLYFEKYSKFFTKTIRIL